MTQTLTIRGVPRALALDGWWLELDPADRATPQPEPDDTRLAYRRRALAVLALVLVGDLLFWQQPRGISVALFAAALFVASLLAQRAAPKAGSVAIILIAVLPVIVHLQALSVAILIVGLGAAIISGHVRAASVADATLRFAACLPLRWLGVLNPRPARAGLRRIFDTSASKTGPGALLRNWAFPLGGGLVLSALLMDANPVLARMLEIDLDIWALLHRAAFWSGIAIFVMPFLTADPSPATASQTRAFTAPDLRRFGINAGSVLRALVLFNGLIGVQSLTDLSILLFGAELPAGITLAEYAHRGAYPLLAAAILAAAFSLAARPFLAEHRLIRPLLLLWLAQNTVLCAAAGMRLELYIDAFGLTYLRLYALIWIGLVAVLLALACWQVLRAHGNRWLVSRGVILGLATLYLCSLVNFAQIIAAENVTRAEPDRAYLCALGGLAAGPVLKHGVGTMRGGQVDLGTCRIAPPRISNWREWGFRSWAAQRYVAREVSEQRP